MKIKVFIFGLALAFCCMSNFAFANSTDTNLDIVNKIEVNDNTQANVQDVVIDFTLDYTTKNVVQTGCKVEGTLTLTTESGDSVSIKFSITADTCKEASKAYNQFMAAWTASQQ